MNPTGQAAKIEEQLQKIDPMLFMKWDDSLECWSVWCKTDRFALSPELRRMHWVALQRSGRAYVVAMGQAGEPLPLDNRLLDFVQRHDVGEIGFSGYMDLLDAEQLAKEEAKKKALEDHAQQFADEYEDLWINVEAGRKSPEHYGRRDENGNLILDDGFSKELRAS